MAAASASSQTEVLIAGAGPTGLVLALWLTRLGVAVRIIDKTAEPGTTSRAVAVAAHTLELYEQLGLASAVVAQGHAVRCVHLWVKGRPAAEVLLGDIGRGLSRFGPMQIFPQDAHERLLVQRLEESGIRVERCTELINLAATGAGVESRLRTPDGREQRVLAKFLAGCDGAHSTVRHLINAGFAGGTYRQLFYVADADAEGAAANGDLHIDLDEADFLAVFPLSAHGRVRVIGSVRDERAASAQTLTFDDVSHQTLRDFDIRIRNVNWFSTYHVHHRVAERFRLGSVFLLGDAAHVHSPVGGQGMNTGIGDAINLAWKLAAVIGGGAPDALLDSYAIERRRFAKRLVATTDRVFTFVTAEGPLARQVRTRVAPRVVPRLFGMHPVRKFLFRTVAQLSLQYRHSPLSEGVAGAVHGGDRLPWAGSDADNFAPLRDPRWQVHVYGTAAAALAQWCRDHRLPLHVFPWQPAYAACGLTEDALYLLRPDTYVALAGAEASPALLDSYFQRQRIRPQLAATTVA
ncbi:MAG: FAD-dependent monooxygenase [Sinobacteraceae bacterium]|nr:FAD-dependent monooxygenase [Nevskiaceae bacterium]